MSIVFTMMAAVLLNSSTIKDCGGNAYRDTIAKTQSLIIKSHEVDVTIGEMPTQTGTRECSRVRFSIGSNGMPMKVSVVESSGNVAVNMAVIRAVKKYIFKREAFSQVRTYMLVFYLEDNKMPKNYLDGVGEK